VKTIRTACILLCAVFLVGAYPFDAHAQTAASTAAQVGQLFDKGEAAFAKGDKQSAYEAFKAAWALQKSYDIAGNLGVVELKLGKYRDAAEHLAWSLENYPPTGEEAQQKATEKRLAEALKEVGRLHVQVNVNGASVIVNGNASGTAPIARTLFVEPGPIVVEAKLAGYLDGRKQVEIAKGGEETVKLSLVPAPPPRRGVVPGAVMGSVAGAALVTGVVLEVVAASKRSEVRTTNASILNEHHSCVTGAANYDARCPQIIDTANSTAKLHDAGIGVLVGAGALAAGAVTYFLWPTSKQGRASGLRPAPVISASGAALTLSGSF
jgi:hypothetical protein